MKLMRGPDGVLVRELLGDVEPRFDSGLFGARPFIMRYPPSPGVVGPEAVRWWLRPCCLSGNSSLELIVVQISSSPTLQPPMPSKSLSGPMLGTSPSALSPTGVSVPADKALELRRRRRLRSGASVGEEPAGDDRPACCRYRGLETVR